MITTDEAPLFVAACAGDQEAFQRLTDPYRRELLVHCYRMLGSLEDAEDILQDSFLEAFRHLSEFNHLSRFSTWVYSIVMNRIRNHLRHNKVIRWTSLDTPRAHRDEDHPPEAAERGFIDSRWGTTVNNRRARYYRLTQRGRTHLREETTRVTEYAQTITSILTARAAQGR